MVGFHDWKLCHTKLFRQCMSVMFPLWREQLLEVKRYLYHDPEEGGAVLGGSSLPKLASTWVTDHGLCVQENLRWWLVVSLITYVFCANVYFPRGTYICSLLVLSQLTLGDWMSEFWFLCYVEAVFSACCWQVYWKSLNSRLSPLTLHFRRRRKSHWFRILRVFNHLNQQVIDWVPPAAEFILFPLNYVWITSHFEPFSDQKRIAASIGDLVAKWLPFDNDRLLPRSWTSTGAADVNSLIGLSTVICRKDNYFAISCS